jgi:hypothetical protein
MSVREERERERKKNKKKEQRLLTLDKAMDGRDISSEAKLASCIRVLWRDITILIDKERSAEENLLRKLGFLGCFARLIRELCQHTLKNKQTREINHFDKDNASKKRNTDWRTYFLF